jgi:hypothetical protein
MKYLLTPFTCTRKQLGKPTDVTTSALSRIAIPTGGSRDA